MSCTSAGTPPASQEVDAAPRYRMALGCRRCTHLQTTAHRNFFSAFFFVVVAAAFLGGRAEVDVAAAAAVAEESRGGGGAPPAAAAMAMLPLRADAPPPRRRLAARSPVVAQVDGSDTSFSGLGRAARRSAAMFCVHTPRGTTRRSCRCPPRTTSRARSRAPAPCARRRRSAARPGLRRERLAARRDAAAGLDARSMKRRSSMGSPFPRCRSRNLRAVRARDAVHDVVDVRVVAAEVLSLNCRIGRPHDAVDD